MQAQHLLEDYWNGIISRQELYRQLADSGLLNLLPIAVE